MKQHQFIQPTNNPIMRSLDAALERMFSQDQSQEERRAELERKEDEFLARKQKEQA